LLLIIVIFLIYALLGLPKRGIELSEVGSFIHFLFLPIEKPALQIWQAKRCI
jgi:hypothetical protein